jgi:2-polyprenyl-6-hydroxyphenyl methylase/3-demethylubiquinone-9 3-methyltransferase
MNIDSSTVDINEVEKFSRMSEEWWDEFGKFKPLHQINPLRIEYIIYKIKNYIGINDSKEYPLKGLSILDIGCGGGLLSEPMARLGADVIAVDASEENIKIAKIHAERNNLNISYIHTTAEELVKEQKQFDVVLAMEIVEHVANVELFLHSTAKLVKNNGMLFVSTLNKTLKAYTLAILGAEYLLKWVPVGTHEWEKFLTPAQINKYLRENNFDLQHLQGISFNPVNRKWYFSEDIKVNYMLCATKI